MPPKDRIHILFKLAGNFHQDRSHPGPLTHLTNSKEQKPYKVRSWITMELNRKSVTKESWKSPKYVETKQHTFKEHVSQGGVKRNLKIFRSE